MGGRPFALGRLFGRLLDRLFGNVSIRPRFCPQYRENPQLACHLHDRGLKDLLYM
jgi:hypothetical protein